MQAFHSNWTKPFFINNQSKYYYIEDFELLTTILSALEWQQYNGDIKMVTDDIGAEYYYKLGLKHIWNLGIDTTLKDVISDDISPFLFWAAGKIFALQMQQTPCIMIDTDFIVWKSIVKELITVPLTVIHREDINDSIYPDKSYFNMSQNYKFPSQWDWTVRPCNTAFTYIEDKNFKDYYTNHSIQFMNELMSDTNSITNMVFAEQRIISMCAKEKGIPIKSLIELKNANIENQQHFTHTWGYKSILRASFSKRKEFCIRCIRRILTDFPEQQDIIANMNNLKLYYKEAIQNL